MYTLDLADVPAPDSPKSSVSDEIGRSQRGMMVTTRTGRCRAGDHTSTTGGASIFNRQFVEDTAAFNRDLKDIIKRNPFAVVVAGPEAPLSIAGINPAYNNLTIDGVKQNDDFGLNDNGYPSQRSPISLETVEQLSVTVSPGVHQAYTGYIFAE